MIEFVLGLSPGLLVASLVIAFIALVSQMSLYAKAGQPPISALVPVWNVIVFCKTVGRPAKHAWLLIGPGLVMLVAVAMYWPQIDGLFPAHGSEGLIPGPTKFSEVIVPISIIGVATIPLIWIMVQLFTEVCDSFGKHKTIDKVLCVFFNGAYILFVLGISDAAYESPWWARKRGLPYYMPDFKHKGKKYLVTPEGPLVGDWREQKLKIKIVDDPKVVANADQTAVVGEKVKEEIIVTAKEVSEAPKEELKVKVDSTPKVEAKPSEKGATDKKKEEPKAKAKKADSKAASDASGKTWREQALEKYKKKK